MHTISFLNRKGGVGKTSTCYHLAGALRRRGFNVLLVDLDPQASLTQGILGPDQTHSLDLQSTVAGLYQDPEAWTADIIIRTGLPGLDLVAGSTRLEKHNTSEPINDPYWKQRSIELFLGTVQGYDLALIDCPPNLLACAWMALLASTHVLVPVMPEDYGAQGIALVDRFVDLARTVANPNLIHLGYLLNRFGRTKSIHKYYQQRLDATYPGQVWDAYVPDAVAYVEAISAGKPVEYYAPRSAAAVSARLVAAELVQRTGIEILDAEEVA